MTHPWLAFLALAILLTAAVLAWAVTWAAHRSAVGEAASNLCRRWEQRRC